MDFPCPSSTLTTFSSHSATEYLNQKSSFLHQAILLPSLARGCTAVPGLKSYFTLLLHMCIFELNKFNPVKFILKSKPSICQNWKQLQQFLPGEFYSSSPTGKPYVVQTYLFSLYFVTHIRSIKSWEHVTVLSCTNATKNSLSKHYQWYLREHRCTDRDTENALESLSSGCLI